MSGQQETLDTRAYGEARRAQQEAVRARYLRAVRDNPDVSRTQLARRFGIGVTTAKTWAREAGL